LESFRSSHFSLVTLSTTTFRNGEIWIYSDSTLVRVTPSLLFFGLSVPFFLFTYFSSCTSPHREVVFLFLHLVTGQSSSLSENAILLIKLLGPFRNPYSPFTLFSRDHSFQGPLLQKGLFTRPPCLNKLIRLVYHSISSWSHHHRNDGWNPFPPP